MANAIDKVTAHFSGLETVSFTVPEWGGLEIFVAPMTLKVQQTLLRKTKSLDDVGSAVEALLLLAKDAEGEPVFTLEDKPKLMVASDPTVVGRVAAQVLNAHAVEEPGE